MAIELVGDQCDLYDKLSEATHAHPPGTVFNLTGERACYLTSNGDVFWMRGVRCGCGTLAEAVRALTVQMLGPIELDANGEADGEGWRVERFGTPSRYRLLIGTGGGAWRVSAASVTELESEIEKLHGKAHVLRRWCEDVGWFRGEVVVDSGRRSGKAEEQRQLAQPDALTYICKRCDAWTPFDADADSEFDDDDFDDDDFDDESDVYEGPFARGTSACDGLCLPQCDWCLVGHLCPDECGGGAECPYVSLAKEASADPAVVRFREEHWHVVGRRDRSAHQPTPQQIAARLDALELAKSTRHPFPPELLAEWRNGTGRPNARALQELRDYAAELRDAAGELVEACDAVDR